METKKVPIEKYIEQVTDGVAYKGTLKVANAEFDYELTFTVPIPKLDSANMPTDKEEIPKLILITLKQDTKEIALTNDEYGFFFYMLAKFAVSFYNNPQTRASNQGIVGDLLRQTGPLAELGAKISLGIQNSASYHLPVDLCKTLNASKFGCEIAI